MQRAVAARAPADAWRGMASLGPGFCLHSLAPLTSTLCRGGRRRQRRTGCKGATREGGGVGSPLHQQDRQSRRFSCSIRTCICVHSYKQHLWQAAARVRAGKRVHPPLLLLQQLVDSVLPCVAQHGARLGPIRNIDHVPQRVVAPVRWSGGVGRGMTRSMWGQTC